MQLLRPVPNQTLTVFLDFAVLYFPVLHFAVYYPPSQSLPPPEGERRATVVFICWGGYWGGQWVFFFLGNGYTEGRKIKQENLKQGNC